MAQNSEFVTLVIKIPSQFEGTPENVHGILDALINTIPKKIFSIDANVLGRKLYFSVHCKPEDQPIIENQLYSTFEDIEIEQLSDPMSFDPKKSAKGEIRLKEKDYFPIPTYDEIPASVFIKIISQSADLDLNDKMTYQIVLQPFNTHNIFFQFFRRVKYRWFMFLHKFNLHQRFIDNKIKIKTEAASKKYKEKNTQDMLLSKLSFYLQSESQQLARAKAIALLKNLSDLENTENKVDFEVKPMQPGDAIAVRNPGFRSRKYFLTAKEAATFWHFPRTQDKIPHILRILSKKARPPLGLPTRSNTGPKDLVEFAVTNYRSQRIPFGLKTKDKARHMYVVGKSGSGKSKFLELLGASDIANGRGFAVLDPHGDLVDNILKYIPEHRAQDVVVFDPTDLAHPVGFNPLEEVPEEYRQEFTNSFLEIFKKLFGEAWNARLEHVMRFCVLALLEVGNATVLSIIKLLTDRDYRQSIIKKLEDQTVKNFWTNEFAAWSEKFDSEAIMPILNKVAQFVSSPMIRNIVCQVDNAMDLSKIMDERKILLVKLSKGQLGESNANLIGAMMITRIYQAALMRSAIPEDDRVPFSMYLDEFQNFATDTFENILSEVRKYKLNICVAHQYMDQLSAGLRKTIFGNVANIISFRVGAEDAAILAQEYSPVFSVPDIMNLGVREMYLKINIDGENTEAFSARSMDVPSVKNDLTSRIMEYSRKNYSKPRKQVEDFIFGSSQTELQTIQELKQEEDFEAPLI